MHLPVAEAPREISRAERKREPEPRSRVQARIRFYFRSAPRYARIARLGHGALLRRTQPQFRHQLREASVDWLAEHGVLTLRLADVHRFPALPAPAEWASWPASTASIGSLPRADGRRQRAAIR